MTRKNATVRITLVETHDKTSASFIHANSIGRRNAGAINPVPRRNPATAASHDAAGLPFQKRIAAATEGTAPTEKPNFRSSVLVFRREIIRLRS